VALIHFIGDITTFVACYALLVVMLAHVLGE